MHIKAVTLEEARAMANLLETGPVQSRGTIDEQCVMYASLSSFAAKLAAALSGAEAAATQADDGTNEGARCETS